MFVIFAFKFEYFLLIETFKHLILEVSGQPTTKEDCKE